MLYHLQYLEQAWFFCTLQAQYTIFICKTSRSKEIFRKIDHSMIYILIAGTYTPITLVLLRGALGWTIFGIIWALAISGVIIKANGFKIKKWISTGIYILMGWMIVIPFYPLSKTIPSEGLWWLFIGGISYTIGTIFFALDTVIPKRRWFSMHDIFHLFVIAGSFSHFWLMFRYVLYAG